MPIETNDTAVRTDEYGDATALAGIEQGAPIPNVSSNTPVSSALPQIGNTPTEEPTIAPGELPSATPMAPDDQNMANELALLRYFAANNPKPFMKSFIEDYLSDARGIDAEPTKDVRQPDSVYANSEAGASEAANASENGDAGTNEIQ